MKPHDKFELRGKHLYTKIRISLQEALCGFDKIPLKHIDGRGIRVKHNAGMVIKPGSYKRIPREGMPTYLRPDDKGDLYIQFKVDFPDDMWTSSQNLDLLQNLLPGSKDKIDEVENMVVDECSLLDINFDPSRDSENRSRQAHRDDLNNSERVEGEIRPRPATGVGCPQQ